MKLFFLTLHILAVTILTILSQVGGLVYLISVITFKGAKARYLLKRVVFFFAVYLAFNKVIIPFAAPILEEKK